MSKRQRFCAAAACGWLVVLACAAPRECEAARPMRATVERILDGATIEVSISGKKEKVRLIGIETPGLIDSAKVRVGDRAQDSDKAAIRALAKLSTRYAEEVLSGKKITLEFEPFYRRDRAGRMLAYVRLGGGGDFNEAMLRDGYAYAYSRNAHSRTDRYRSAEASARRGKKGLWAEDAVAVAAAPEESPASTDPGDAIVYITSTGATYHSAGCKRMRGVRHAVSLKDAVADHYSPCRYCVPPVLKARADDPTRSGTTDATKVYVTMTGRHYHRADCAYVRKQAIAITLGEARKRYRPCPRCKPPE